MNEERHDAANFRNFIVYRNDIKYRSKREIDIDRAEFVDDEVRSDYLNCDTDGIDYRIKECHIEGDTVLDLSHMTSHAFEELIAHPDFSILRERIAIITANESDIAHVPDMRMFPKLVAIDLSGNVLQELPRFPDSLEELIIDNNNVSHVPHIVNLKRLRAKNNDLREIEFNASLESLIVSDNPNLTQLAALDNLYLMEIAKTGIKTVPSCSKLKFLDMDDTAITTLPEMDSLAILSCSRSELSDISRLTSLFSIVAGNSKLRRLHYMASLQTFSFNEEHYDEVLMSSKYVVKRMIKNKDNIIELVFKDKLVPKRILN